MLEVNFDKQIGSFKLKSSFKLDNGILGVLGSSGCGKSMTLKCIAGLYIPEKGKVILNNRVLFSSEEKINIKPRNRKIGYVFQDYALLPHLTVENNIAYGLKNLEKNIRKEKVADMINRMHLSGYENRYPSQLSGGQKQRTALARTLVTDPDLLLLDEPFSALDSHIRHELKKELINIIHNNYKGITILVTHNIEEAYRLCDKIMIIDQGNTLQIGGKDEIIQNPSNITSARLTGCKNFLDARIIDEENGDYILKSNDLSFKVKKAVEEYSGEVVAGIRDYYLSLYSSKEKKHENSFLCKVVQEIEGVFSKTLILESGGCQLQLEVPKSSNYLELNNYQDNLWLDMPSEHIFLIRKEKSIE